VDGFKGGAVDREPVGVGSSPLFSPANDADGGSWRCSVASFGGEGSGRGVGNEGFPFDGAAERLIGGRGLPSVLDGGGGDESNGDGSGSVLGGWGDGCGFG
jgi:hypothetical protein